MTTRPEIVGYLDERDLDVMPRDLAEHLQGEERFPFKTPLIRLADYEALAAPAVQGETLADRMRAAGMMTIDEMMNKTPLDGFIRHAGVHDLDSYGQWLDMKCRDFLTMQAKRELNKDPEDDMYEWVIAHAAAFQEARINFSAARHAKTEQQPLSHDWDSQDKCRRCGDRDWYASATCTPKRKPAPDTAQAEAAELADALERCMRSMLDAGFNTRSAVMAQGWQALAAYRKLGGAV